MVSRKEHLRHPPTPEFRGPGAMGHSTARDLPIRWSIIGHLQTNKVKAALALFDLTHSVDSVRLARAISREATAAGRVAEVLLQVNTSGVSDSW